MGERNRYTEYHDDDVIPYFIIGIEEEVEDSGEEDPLSVLAHEMVHVKQYVMGELTWRDRGLMWKGRLYTPENLGEYFETPYEIEAFGNYLGIIFQIKDDLFDFTTKRIGKPTKSDLKSQKITFF